MAFPQHNSLKRKQKNAAEISCPRARPVMEVCHFVDGLNSISAAQRMRNDTDLLNPRFASASMMQPKVGSA